MRILATYILFHQFYNTISIGYGKKSVLLIIDTILTVGFQYKWTNSFVFLLRRIIADCSWLIAADHVTKSEDQ